MRTLELPDEFVERVEALARQRGISAAEFVMGEIVPTLKKESPTVTGRRIDFPLIDSGLPGTLNITPEVIRQVEHEDDMRRSGLLGYE